MTLWGEKFIKWECWFLCSNWQFGWLQIVMQEKLYSMLQEVLKERPGVDIVKLHKSGGVVSRNTKYRQRSRIQKTKVTYLVADTIWWICTNYQFSRFCDELLNVGLCLSDAGPLLQEHLLCSGVASWFTIGFNRLCYFWYAFWFWVLEILYISDLIWQIGHLKGTLNTFQHSQNLSMTFFIISAVPQQEYFYGLSNDLSPHSSVANFSDLQVYRIGGGPQAPRSALPIGAEPIADPTRVVTVSFSRDLLHVVLAVSYAKEPEHLLSRWALLTPAY